MMPQHNPDYECPKCGTADRGCGSWIDHGILHRTKECYRIENENLVAECDQLRTALAAMTQERDRLKGEIRRLTPSGIENRTIEEFYEEQNDGPV